MKTCEQAVPMAELREVMTTARTYLNEGNFPAAFDLAHQASSHVQMVRTPYWCYSKQQLFSCQLIVFFLHV